LLVAAGAPHQAGVLIIPLEKWLGWRRATAYKAVSLRMWSGRRRVHGTLGIRFTMLPAFVVAAIGIALTIMVTALGNSVEARVRRTKPVRLFLQIGERVRGNPNSRGSATEDG
jgi:hypothetical protein